MAVCSQNKGGLGYSWQIDGVLGHVGDILLLEGEFRGYDLRAMTSMMSRSAVIPKIIWRG